MARINIEDSLFNDPRFEVVCSQIGKVQAIGYFVLIVKMAQRYWVEGSIIPKPIFELAKFPKEFVAVELVIEKEDGFYLRGSEESFAWIVAKSKNGKKGGRPKVINDLEKANEKLKKAKVNPSQSYENPLTLTLTPTLTHKNNTLPFREWLGAYHEITGNKDGNTATVKKLVQARIRQGFTLEDCILVVRSKKDQWGSDPKMISYLRPQTLFSGKFETYLDEAKNRHTTSSDARVMALVNDLFPGVNLEA